MGRQIQWMSQLITHKMYDPDEYYILSPKFEPPQTLGLMKSLVHPTLQPDVFSSELNIILYSICLSLIEQWRSHQNKGHAG